MSRERPGTRIPQLTLPLQLPEGRDLTSYVAGPNGGPVAALSDATGGDSAGSGLYLWGGRGLGKSHLLQAAVRARLDVGRTAYYIPLDEPTVAPEALAGLEGADLIALDGLDGIAGTAWEEALFHLHNRAQLGHAALLFAARAAPGGLALTLPDLLTRLQATTVYRLQPLADEELQQLLKVHAHKRGLGLPDAVARYLAQRLPRDGHSLVEALDRLDQAALAAQRMLTIPFCREVLALDRC